MPLKMNKKTWIILFLILALGLCLRLINIDKQSYWMDEALGIYDAGKPGIGGVIEGLKTDQPVAPVYFTILHYWMGLFGSSEAATRALSLIFSCLSIILLFFSVRIISNEKIALISAFIFSISLPEIVFSQETRYYACFTFFALLSTLFYIKILKSKKESFMNYFLYFVSGSLSLYTSYFSVLLIFLHFSFFIFAKNPELRKKKFKYVLISQVFIMLSFLFWLPTFISQFVYWQDYTKQIFMGYNLPEFISNLGLFILISPVIIFVMIIVIFYLFNKKHDLIPRITKWNDKNPYFFLCLVALIFILLFPFLIKSKIGVRYFLFLAPAVYFLVARQIFLFRKKLILFLLISIILISSVIVYYNMTTKAQWREAVDFMNITRNDNKGIIILEEGANVWLTNIYYHGEMKILPLWASESISDDKFMSEMDDKEYAWLILSRNWKRKDYYFDLMSKNFGSPELEKEFYDIRIYLYNLK